MSSENINDSPAMKDYTVQEIVGTGSYSIVYKARQKQVVLCISNMNLKVSKKKKTKIDSLWRFFYLKLTIDINGNTSNTFLFCYLILFTLSLSLPLSCAFILTFLSLFSPTNHLLDMQTFAFLTSKCLFLF